MRWPARKPRCHSSEAGSPRHQQPTLDGFGSACFTQAYAAANSIANIAPIVAASIAVASCVGRELGDRQLEEIEITHYQRMWRASLSITSYHAQ